MTPLFKKALSAVPLLFILSFLIHPSAIYAQQFETGLELYQEGHYERAAAVFNKLEEPKAYLFAGKSYYAMRRYKQSQANLNNISQASPAAIYYESVYTSALVDFQLKYFGNALEKLLKVQSQPNIDHSLTLDSKQFYQQILEYLTGRQRLIAMTEVSAPQIKWDLLSTAMGRVNYNDVLKLYRLYESSVEEEWQDRTSEIAPVLASESTYAAVDHKKLNPPEGTIFNLGIALPRYEPDENEFGIVKSLYMGAFLAGEEFNDDHENIKVSMEFLATNRGTDYSDELIEEFVHTNQGDALIGPLYSEQAASFIPLLNEYKIPGVAPLANSQINSDGSFLFQANPTFAVHGREMARYAVNEMNMRNFAVIARSGTAGAISAETFRDEAEKLGAHVHYYYVEDIHTTDYAVSQYTKYLQTGEKPVDAVYAPITGQGALTIIDLLLLDLRKMTQPPTVLGSQEWQRLDYSLNKYERLKIYFSQGYYASNHGLRMSRFRNKYEQLFNSEPNQFSMIGYDVASFLLTTLDRVKNPALLRSAILTHDKYNGLVNDIYFKGDNVNNALSILKVNDGSVTVVE